MRVTMEAKTNPRTLNMVKEMYALSEKEGAAIWKDLAKRFEKPRRNWAEVNLSRLNRVTKKGDVIVVPGKILGNGLIEHPIEAYVFSISESAKSAIEKAKGKVGIIEDLMKKNPKATGVRIIK